MASAVDLLAGALDAQRARERQLKTDAQTRLQWVDSLIAPIDKAVADAHRAHFYAQRDRGALAHEKPDPDRFSFTFDFFPMATSAGAISRALSNGPLMREGYICPRLRLWVRPDLGTYFVKQSTGQTDGCGGAEEVEIASGSVSQLTPVIVSDVLQQFMSASIAVLADPSVFQVFAAVAAQELDYAGEIPTKGLWSRLFGR